MLTLSTDNDGVVGTARNMASALKKAKAYADENGQAVYIMQDQGETGYETLAEVY